MGGYSTLGRGRRRVVQHDGQEAAGPHCMTYVGIDVNECQGYMTCAQTRPTLQRCAACISSQADDVAHIEDDFTGIRCFMPRQRVYQCSAEQEQ